MVEARQVNSLPITAIEEEEEEEGIYRALSVTQKALQLKKQQHQAHKRHYLYISKTVSHPPI